MQVLAALTAFRMTLEALEGHRIEELWASTVGALAPSVNVGSKSADLECFHTYPPFVQLGSSDPSFILDLVGNN